MSSKALTGVGEVLTGEHEVRPYGRRLFVAADLSPYGRHRFLGANLVFAPGAARAREKGERQGLRAGVAFCLLLLPDFNDPVCNLVRSRIVRIDLIVSRALVNRRPSLQNLRHFLYERFP